MTAIPLSTAPPTTAPRAKSVFYVRSFVALAMIITWTVSALGGLALWLAVDGWRAYELPSLLGLTRHTWTDIHVVASFLAIALTITHVTVMRRGVISYGRLVLTGRRSSRAAATRRPKAVVYVRALAVVTMVALVPVVIASGIVPWLATDGRRAGQQLLLLALTKHEWSDIHTAVAAAVVLVAVTHVVVVRTGLMADVRLLATGQRSAPRGARH